MSAFATTGGGVGVAYANTAFRNLGLMEFELADLEGVVVQVDVEFVDSQHRRMNRATSRKLLTSPEVKLWRHKESKSKNSVTAVQYTLPDFVSRTFSFADCSGAAAASRNKCLGSTRRLTILFAILFYQPDWRKGVHTGRKRTVTENAARDHGAL